MRESSGQGSIINMAYDPNVGTYKPAPRNDFERVMETKKDNIAEAQKRKQTSMEMLACFRDATLLTVAEISKSNFDNAPSQEDAETKMKEMWERWHGWLKNKLDKEILGF